MNYILFTGAPGSKWSSVVKNIYYSDDIDRSDYKESRTYWHDADTPGSPQLMHIGAYWDPGMEFSPEAKYWDAAFDEPKSYKKRIIKSHVFAHTLNSLKNIDCPIVLVYRNDYECLEWWKLCGEFNITYPLYAYYYKNLDNMWLEIQKQNHDILTFIKENKDRVTRVFNNSELCEKLGITLNGVNTTQNYKEKDITVYVYK